MGQFEHSLVFFYRLGRITMYEYMTEVLSQLSSLLRKITYLPSTCIAFFKVPVTVYTVNCISVYFNSCCVRVCSNVTVGQHLRKDDSCDRPLAYIYVCYLCMGRIKGPSAQQFVQLFNIAIDSYNNLLSFFIILTTLFK